MAATTPGPIEILGTKWPSITSTCTQSQPALSMARTSSPSFAKSADRIEGAIRIGLAMSSRSRAWRTGLAGHHLLIPLGDQIVGQGEAWQRHKTMRPGLHVGPTRDLHPALGHEHHASPAADVGNATGFAHQPRAVLQPAVHVVERRFRKGAHVCHDCWINRAKAGVVTHARDVLNSICLPGKPFTRPPAIRLAGALEPARDTGKVVEDHVRL